MDSHTSQVCKINSPNSGYLGNYVWGLFLYTQAPSHTLPPNTFLKNSSKDKITILHNQLPKLWYKFLLPAFFPWCVAEVMSNMCLPEAISFWYHAVEMAESGSLVTMTSKNWMQEFTFVSQVKWIFCEYRLFSSSSGRWMWSASIIRKKNIIYIPLICRWWLFNTRRQYSFLVWQENICSNWGLTEAIATSVFCL